MDKPIAELRIIRRESGCDSYLLEAGGVLIWNTRAYPTAAGRAGAKERMRLWLARHPHEVRMVGEAPPLESEEEAQFWTQFERVLGGRQWARVEQLLGKTTPRPTTVRDWNELFKLVDKALKAQTTAA